MTTKLLTPIAIVIAGALIAGAVLYTQGFNGSLSDAPIETRDPTEIADIREDDHVRGNPDAAVTFIEYSDFECPFCARFHPTMERLISELPEVNWIYRHFPLTSIHSRALSSAVASECAAKFGGNDAFWVFADGLFEKQQRLGTELYEELAIEAGIAGSEFSACLTDENMVSKVREQFDEAVSVGGQGTPYVVVRTASGQVIPFSGALPYDQIKQIAEAALEN